MNLNIIKQIDIRKLISGLLNLIVTKNLLICFINKDGIKTKKT